ncbi:IS66 family transposase, partial [Planctomycetota bacterium]
QEHDAPDIFAQFIEYMTQLSNWHGFHYGNYDVKAVASMKKSLPGHLQVPTDVIIENSTNVLSVIYPHVYFPTYANRLKDIGMVLGCRWSHENASGIQSIIWRENWEENHEIALKLQLLQYNKEDCLALKTVCHFISSITSKTEFTIPCSNQEQKIRHTDELRRFAESKRPIFGKKDSVLKDFEHINNCAYFDYQREKVFVRTDRKFKRINKRAKKKNHKSYRINKYSILHCTECPYCTSKKIKGYMEMAKRIIDLKFFKSGTGIKRWVTEYSSWRYRCKECQKCFVSEEWPVSRTIYGNGLISWCLYHNIARKQIMMQVHQSLIDLFELHIPLGQLYKFKSSRATYYSTAYTDILNRILNGSILHIDETPVKLKGKSGYVWVFACMDKVYYFYKNSREGTFLKEMLNSFSGVLISDFFTAYDSLDCPQQKCLLHLIRDINDDLMRNPFDSEFKMLAQQFSKLLREIIDTVDCYGLKKRHLHKHKKAILRFFKTVCSTAYSSELAQKYQKRFKKYQYKLFTFLDYDGVPWNNNNAEHAIHAFAKYRRFSDGMFSERSIKEYLVIMSVLETCEYNNMNVMKFLLSKHKGSGF